MEAAVICKGVKKRFGRGERAVWALRGVDLEVGVGELVMVVGPSGSGKTTLLSVVAGMLDREEGECLVYGRDFQRMGARERARCRAEEIGFVFQSYNLIPALTAEENTAIPLLIAGVDQQRAIRQARDLLEGMGLQGRTGALPKALSGGEQQRCAIGRALIHGPRLVVCDEPTSALDHETGVSVVEQLKERAAGNGKSLIIVTHDARIFPYADRIARMDDGVILTIEGNR